jgi:hypothetical protein
VGFQPVVTRGACSQSVRGGAHVECSHFIGRGHWCVRFSPVLTAIAALPGFFPSSPWLLPWEKPNMVGVAVQGAPEMDPSCHIVRCECNVIRKEKGRQSPIGRAPKHFCQSVRVPACMTRCAFIKYPSLEAMWTKMKEFEKQARCEGTM